MNIIIQIIILLNITLLKLPSWRLKGNVIFSNFLCGVKIQRILYVLVYDWAGFFIPGYALGTIKISAQVTFANFIKIHQRKSHSESYPKLLPGEHSQRLYKHFTCSN